MFAHARTPVNFEGGRKLRENELMPPSQPSTLHHFRILDCQPVTGHRLTDVIPISSASGER